MPTWPSAAAPRAASTPWGSCVRNSRDGCCSTSNACPEKAVAPFDASAAGTAIGEGGGLLILEEYEAAKARGAKIICEIVGFGASQDAYSISEPDPSGTAYGAAITKALADAKVKPSEVSCLIPCATGHPRMIRRNWPACSVPSGRP